MTKDEALKLAEYWETRAKDLQTWVDENDFVEFGYRPEGLKREQADQRRTAAELRRLHEVNQELLEALKYAEAALSDIGDADREPGDDVAWCEARAAQAIPQSRAAIAKATGEQA